MTPKTPARGYVEAWEVESLTEPGKVYTVSRRLDQSLACSCPAWKFAHAPKPDCKHIRALRAGLISSPIPAPVLINVFFDGQLVAKLTRSQADSVRSNLAAISGSAFATTKRPEPETVISSEFRIKRKFRFED